MWEVLVPRDREGMRIQEGLVGLMEEVLPSRKACRKALDSGRVAVLRGSRWIIATTALRLEVGDRVRVEPHAPTPASGGEQLVIGHEDGAHAVVWKPAGWVTSGTGRPSLREAVAGQLVPSDAADALARPEPVHRLDRGTAGWVLVAKTARAAAVLGEQVAPEGAALKTYQAVCWGVAPVAGRLLVPLDGRPAGTEFERRARGMLGTEEACWLEVTLATGRTHQIRRHLSGLGHPILGDRAYGGGEGSLMLVCSGLAYLDPVTHQPRSLNASLPKRFRRIPWIRRSNST